MIDVIPKEILSKLPHIYESVATTDPICYVKFFTPDSNFTWYILEIDDDNNLCFGYVVSHFSEYGYFTLLELESLRGPMSLKVERDIYFQKMKMHEILNLHNEIAS